jgi:hypothetical protein
MSTPSKLDRVSLPLPIMRYLQVGERDVDGMRRLRLEPMTDVEATPSPDLLDLIEERRAYWRVHAPRVPVARLFAIGGITFIGMAVGATILPVLLPFMAFRFVAMLGFVLPLVFSVIIARHVLRPDVLRAGPLMRILHEPPRCPDCAYDLSAGDMVLGPPNCPECGTDWPLIPPPTPEEIERRDGPSRHMDVVSHG